MIWVQHCLYVCIPHQKDNTCELYFDWMKTQEEIKVDPRTFQCKGGSKSRQKRIEKPCFLPESRNWKTMLFAGIEAVLSDTFNVLKWRKHNHTFSLIVTFGFQDWFKTLLKNLFKILLKKICEDYLKSIFLSLLKQSWRTLHWQLISIQIIIV